MNNPAFVKAWFELNYLSEIEEEKNPFKVKKPISQLD
jgi:hypothetical protein